MSFLHNCQKYEIIYKEWKCYSCRGLWRYLWNLFNNIQYNVTMETESVMWASMHVYCSEWGDCVHSVHTLHWLKTWLQYCFIQNKAVYKTFCVSQISTAVHVCYYTFICKKNDELHIVHLIEAHLISLFHFSEIIKQ